MNEDKAMKAYKALRGMESAADLKKAKFTLYDYHEACECLREYARNNGEEGTSTLNKAVADWYRRQGFEVTEQGENGKAFVLPVRPSANDKKSVIKEYKQKPYIFPELVGANSEHVFYRDKKTYALYTDWEGEIWYCGDAYGDIDFNSRLILPKYPVDGVRLVTD